MVHFPLGSLVLLWSTELHVELSEKLLRPYSGPYKVLCRITDVAYEIVATVSPGALSSTGPPTSIVHVAHLKPYQLPLTGSLQKA